MSIKRKRFNEFPEGSGSLSNDDIFLFMDNPSGTAVTKKISLSQIASAIGGGGGGGGSDISIGTVDLHNGGTQNAQILQFNDPNYQAVITGPTPPSGNSAQRLIIQGQRAVDNGEGGDVYIWGGDSDTNGGDIKIYAGDADSESAGTGGYVNIDGGNGYNQGGNVGISAGNSSVQGGNVNISAGYPSGNVNINTNAGGWVFNTDGQLLLPGGQAQIAVENDNGVRIGTSAPNTSPNTQIRIGGAEHAFEIFGGPPGFSWKFDSNGSLTFPNNAAIFPVSGTIEIIPNTELLNNDQYLIVDPTSPNHIHLRAGGNIDSSNAELIIGGEHAHVKVIDAGHQVNITADSGLGSLSFAVHYNNSGGQSPSFYNGLTWFIPTLENIPVGSTFEIAGQQYTVLVSTTIDLTLQTWPFIGTNAPLELFMGPGGEWLLDGVYFTASTPSALKTWTFGNDGNLNIPGNILLNNGTSVAVGSYDNGTGGNGGISLNCAVGYELNWQGGHLRSSQIDNPAVEQPLFIDSPLIVDSGIAIGTVNPTGSLHIVNTGIALCVGDYDSAGAGGKLAVFVDDKDSKIQGVKTFVSRSGIGWNIGVNGTSYTLNGIGSGRNIGLYAYAGNAVENWGLWVHAGDSIFNDKVAIGKTNPSYNLDVVGTGSFSQNLLVNNIPVSVSGHSHPDMVINGGSF